MQAGRYGPEPSMYQQSKYQHNLQKLTLRKETFYTQIGVVDIRKVIAPKRGFKSSSIQIFRDVCIGVLLRVNGQIRNDRSDTLEVDLQAVVLHSVSARWNFRLL